MKPRTRIEHEVISLSRHHIAELSSKQSYYAKVKCFEKFAKSTARGEITCLECGHKWNNIAKPKRVICPQCAARMKVEVSRKMKWAENNYFGVMDAAGGYQVLRTFYIERHLRAGTPVHYFICELSRQFMITDKKKVLVARSRTMNGDWSWGSDLEIRRERTSSWYGSSNYQVGLECMCPGYKVSKEIMRNGFKGECYGIEPFMLFKAILNDPKAETMLKTKQGLLLRRHLYHCDVSKYWRSVCICNRNKYIIKDAGMWIDYLSMLEREGKDILNAKYVCPKDLKRAHDELSAKIQIREKREQKERERLKALENEKTFKELKSKYFGVEIVRGDIQIKVLDSVEAFLEEGAAMHHCVFSGAYYLKPDSLILSATIKGVRVETVEVSLKTLKVVQSRGVCNSQTDHHDKIIRLVNREIKKQIRSRLTA